MLGGFDQWQLLLPDVVVVHLVPLELLAIERIDHHNEALVEVLAPILVKAQLLELQGQTRLASADHFAEVCSWHAIIDHVTHLLVPHDGEARVLPALVVHEPDKQSVLLSEWVFHFFLELLHLLLFVVDIFVKAVLVAAVRIFWRSVRILRGAKIAEQIFFVHRLARTLDGTSASGHVLTINRFIAICLGIVLEHIYSRVGHNLCLGCSCRVITHRGLVRLAGLWLCSLFIVRSSRFAQQSVEFLQLSVVLVVSCANDPFLILHLVVVSRMIIDRSIFVVAIISVLRVVTWVRSGAAAAANSAVASVFAVAALGGTATLGLES